MKDQISISRVGVLHPEIRKSVIDFIDEIEAKTGLLFRIVQGLRTFDEQQAIYDQGRTKPGKIVTNAKPGSSYHNYGLAIDIVPIVNGKPDWNFKYETIYDIAEKHGFTCGGKFKSIVDKPHFEKNYGLKWRELLSRHQARDFIKGTNYVNIFSKQQGLV